MGEERKKNQCVMEQRHEEICGREKDGAGYYVIKSVIKLLNMYILHSAGRIVDIVVCCFK